jgi:hypothetical protein
MVGFYLVTYWSVTAMGFVAAGLILAASAVLVPAARRHEPMQPPAAPTTPPSPVDQGQP